MERREWVSFLVGEGGRGGYPSGPKCGDHPLPFQETEKMRSVVNSTGTDVSVHATEGGSPPSHCETGGVGGTSLLDEEGRGWVHLTA